MIRVANDFIRDEDGAVTIDWVVITALVVGLSMVTYLVIQTATTNMGGNVDTALSRSTVSTGTSAGGNGGIATAGTSGS
ncbi:hypothetical protein SAMN05444279_11069 [Ruegeria intermedia]|uniref:Flp pilus assembly protein, pilin Flp n=1 Tax=Ruegeria intermedia TaxID=996115 RepID=A0A1M4X113_9RHOB|nr:hypothetical protein [Ruegeria intermedia]SHE87188.1 hypothetical protein SAMN05444279_11069 [Ruegeria intermedia]